MPYPHYPKMRQRGKPTQANEGGHSSVRGIERAIASRWDMKYPEMTINGLEKGYIGNYCGFEVYRVDSDFIQNNLDVLYGNGGHGLVHLFIPLHEIWLDDRNYPWATIVLHEATEFYSMLFHGMDYIEAHEIANMAETMHETTPSRLEKDIIDSTCPEIRQLVQGLSPAQRMPNERSSAYFSRIAKRP